VAARPVILLFAMIHDSQRLSDGYDPEHGARAAAIVTEFGTTLGDADHQLLLQAACERHDKGAVSDDPTLGVCFDADRLNLWRVGITPKPDLLGTVVGKQTETITWARDQLDLPLPDPVELACRILQSPEYWE
jgi:uncharacterized protein